MQYAEKSEAERAMAEMQGAKVCGRGVVVDWAVDSRLHTALKREEAVEKKPSGKKDAKEKAAARKSGLRGSDGGEEEDEEADGEVGSDKRTAEEVRRMKALLEGDDEDAKPDDAEEKEEKDDDDEEEKPKQDPGWDVGEKKTVFVRNVPFDAGEDDLRETFKKFGMIRVIRLVADPTGANPHKGVAFVHFREIEGADAALAAEAEADQKLKELSAVMRKSDRRDLPAVEGFGICCKGRRLVLKEAVAPPETVDFKRKGREKGTARKERSQWWHLVKAGEIKESHPEWDYLSPSEKRQRKSGMAERKFRISNPNFLIDPLRLTLRNLPRQVGIAELRDAVVKHLMADRLKSKPEEPKKERMRAVTDLIVKAHVSRDTERKDEKGQARSRGYGFIAFKEHDTAMKVLEYVNDNVNVFGKGKRPIVEFTIDDKRKVRMQQELHMKFQQKLKNLEKEKETLDGIKAEGGDDAEGDEKKDGEKDGQGGFWHDDSEKKKRKRNRWKPGESRGRLQREKRRAQKAAEEAKKSEWADTRERRKKWKEEARQESEAMKALNKKKPLTKVPDSDILPANKKQRKADRAGRGGPIRPAAKPGQLADDFELKAMERFRQAGF